ncbi:MAG: choice-of-anchor D domain-containing protein [Candidatus Hatepunaea meridiana]|nr:choice-of-anchor D domain-containing protein [Candidatus Hatepunaea meridiana]
MRQSVFILAILILLLPFLHLEAQEIRQIGFCDTPGQARIVTVVDDYAYIADMRGGLRIMDVSDPEDPEEVGNYNTAGWAEYVTIVDEYAYVAIYTAGLCIIDISDPEHPDLVGSFDTQSAAHSVKVVGDYAFVADWNGLCVIDVSDPEDPHQVAYLNTNGCAYDITVAGDYAYIGDQMGGVVIIDISDPERPCHAAIYDTPDWALCVYIVDDIAYVADRTSGLRLVDISDPEDPDQISVFDTPDWAHVVTVRRNYAYLGDRNTGVHLIDVSDPEHPDEVASCDTPGWAVGIDVVGRLIYLCDFESGFRIFRVTGFGITVDPEELAFDVVAPGSSEDATITISNGGEEEYTIENASVEGEYFSVDFEDEFTIEPDESAELTVTFAPEEAGEFEGVLTITTDDENAEEIEIPLSGESVGPVIWVNRRTLHFGEVGINQSRELSISIRNRGLLDLVISDISVNVDCFSIDFEEEFTLEPDQRRTVNITFTPENSREYEGSLTITSNDPNNSEYVLIIDGTGVGPVIDVEPERLNFGEVGIELSEELTLTINSVGLADLTVSNITTDGECFSVNFEEEFTIEPEDSRELTVTFTPERGVEYEGSLTINSNDENNGEVTVPLSGAGVGAIIMVDTDTLGFGEVGLARNSELSLNISNEGLIDLHITDIITEGGYFDVEFIEELTIQPGRSQDVTVSFAPERSGACVGILIIASDDRHNDELVIPLYGTGVGPMIAVDQDSLDFGLISVNRSEAHLLNISAEGLTDLTVYDISVEGEHFSADFDEEIFIEMGDRYQLFVTFIPEDDGLFTGVITITSNDENNPEVMVHLSGSAFKGVLSDTPDLARGVFVDDNFAYIADSDSGLRVVNVFDPENPVEIWHFDTPGNALSVTVVEDYIFIADGSGGLRILDVSNPLEMGEIAVIETPGITQDVAVIDDYAFVADGESGMIVINVYDPDRPVEVGCIDTPGEAHSITVVGDYAYIADDIRGLRIIDVSNPEHPEEVGYYDTRGWAWDVFVSGDYAYVADERRGLRIIDISDPERPEEVGYYDTPENAFGVMIDGDYAYVTDGDGGLCIIHIGDPENPRLDDTYYTPSCAWDVFVSGNYAYVADDAHGLLILDVTDFVGIDTDQDDPIPTEFFLLPAYPNPFNAVTTITYGLPLNSFVSLEIFDIAGNKVVSLVDRKLPPGIHSVKWTSGNIASGLYFIHLEAQGQVFTKKVILVR